MNLEKTLEEEYTHISPIEIGKVKTEKTVITHQLLTALSECLDNFAVSIFEKKKEYFTKKIRPFQKDITPEEITKVSLHLSNLQSQANFSYAGYFLTTLIDLHRETTNQHVEYKIITAHLEKVLEGIGEENRSLIVIQGNGGGNLGSNMICGKITVSGDCIYDVGSCMKGGTITIKGNVKNSIGHHMTGGEIYVEGNVTEIVGRWMHQGKIIVKGNVENYVGNGLQNGRIEIYGNAGTKIGLLMQGGEIHLHGAYENISEDFINGKIYHQKKLIQTKWKKTWKDRILRIKEFVKNHQSKTSGME